MVIIKRVAAEFPFKEVAMLLMTLKGIKRMLDKALSGNGDVTEVSVENARDMLEELIKECEKKPETFPKTLPPASGTGAIDLDSEAEAAKNEIMGG